MVAAELMAVCSSPRRFYLLMTMLLLFSAQTQAAGISITSASSEKNKGVYQLNADIRYEFSDEVLEALNNGVSITILLTIKLERQRAYLWDESILTLLRRYEMRYHALSGQYIVKKMITGEQQSYLSLESALRALGRIQQLPLIGQDLLKDLDDVVVRIHSELDTNALPAPLRPVAWLEAGWQLRSGWFTCPL